MKTEMSSFDIMTMVGELKGDIRIKKVFQPSISELRVQIRFKEGGTGNILVEVGRNMYLSDFTVPSPRFPSNFVMTLRKYLSNAVVREIKQLGFDRIVEVVAVSGEGDFKLVFELFGEGNAVLTDAEGRIKAVMKPRRFKHRDLIGKEIYSPPPQRSDPFEIRSESLMEVVNEFGSLVKALAVPLGLGGLYAEEVCLRAGLRKDASSISSEESEAVTKVLEELKNEALSPRPVIVYEDGQPIDVTPTRLRVYDGMETKEFQSFNAALDEFFTKRVVERAEEKVEAKFKDGLKTINLRLREQAKAIGKFTRDIREGKLIGDTIYANFEEVQTLIDTVSRVRKTLPAKEISSKLRETEFVKQYLPKENALIVVLGGFKFKLDLTILASKNADYYYSKSKKAKVKLKGARGAAEKTKEKIREYVKKGMAEAQTDVGMPIKTVSKKMKWFEKFRWFKSSEGFLVIGGRDASTNELVVKKHMETGDIFVHADIHGAPAVVIKSEGKSISSKTIDEACQFAASNSTAWKSNAAFLEVYWVNPEQVSKTPMSGEYVAKGAFIIRGKRNYQRSKLALYVGAKLNGEVEVISGPLDAIKEYCSIYVGIEPGRMKSKEAAQKIKEILINEGVEEHKPSLKRLNIDDIQRVLPTGGYAIKGKKK